MGATRAAGKRKAKVKVGLCGSPSLLPPLIPRPPPRITARLDPVQSLRCFVSAWPWLPGWCPVVHRARLLRGAFCSQHRLLLFIASSNICFSFLFLLYYWGGVISGAAARRRHGAAVAFCAFKLRAIVCSFFLFAFRCFSWAIESDRLIWLSGLVRAISYIFADSVVRATNGASSLARCEWYPRCGD